MNIASLFRPTLAKFFLLLILIAVVVIFSLFEFATSNTYPSLVAHSIESLTPPKTLVNKKNKPTLGIAFGGGGVRGFIHIGVIKALDEAGIKADVVTGSSAGAFVAAAYASGMSYEQVDKIVASMQTDDLRDLVLSRRGIIQGQKIAQWVNENIGNKQNSSLIENMPIPLGITVTDVKNQASLLVTQGNIGEAVQASSSIPGVFVPIQAGGSTWVDGGILSLVPVDFTRAMGADVVIGVGVYCGNFPNRLKRSNSNDGQEGLGIMLYYVSRLQTCALNKSEFESADISISPDFEPKAFRNFKEKDLAIDAGYKATKKLIVNIKAMIGQ